MLGNISIISQIEDPSRVATNNNIDVFKHAYSLLLFDVGL